MSGTTYEVARRKMLRALVEFRIRGVKVARFSSCDFMMLELSIYLDKHSILIPTSDP